MEFLLQDVAAEKFPYLAAAQSASGEDHGLHGAEDMHVASAEDEGTSTAAPHQHDHSTATDEPAPPTNNTTQKQGPAATSQQPATATQESTAAATDPEPSTPAESAVETEAGAKTTDGDTVLQSGATSNAGEPLQTFDPAASKNTDGPLCDSMEASSAITSPTSTTTPDKEKMLAEKKSLRRKRKPYVPDENRFRAAAKIQAHWHGFVVRRAYRDTHRVKAATTIQALARGAACRRLHGPRLRESQRRAVTQHYLAATGVPLSSLPERHRRHVAATRIQCGVRRMLARAASRNRRRANAARAIQRVYLGFRERLAAKTLRKQMLLEQHASHATTKIQSLVRGWRARRHFVNLEPYLREQMQARVAQRERAQRVARVEEEARQLQAAIQQHAMQKEEHELLRQILASDEPNKVVITASTRAAFGDVKSMDVGLKSKATPTTRTLSPLQRPNFLQEKVTGASSSPSRHTDHYEYRGAPVAPLQPSTLGVRRTLGQVRSAAIDVAVKRMHRRLPQLDSPVPVASVSKKRPKASPGPAAASPYSL